MNNELFTLNQIFNDRIFRIPDYQRGYAWGEPQLKAFWEDLVTLDTERKHYTGLISIQSVPESKWRNWNEEQWLIKQGNKPFFVVDGQQRLTTISIFMQALFETNTRLAEAGDPNVDTKYLGGYAIKEKLIEKFIKIDEPRHGIYTAYKFGYEIDNPSFSFLRYKIFNQSNPPQLKETLYTLNLERAKKFFMKNLENLYASKGVKSLEDIFEALTQRFLFNLYELHDDFDVCVAFETMNNRGKPLSHLELLKNRLIYLTTLYPSSVVDDASKAVARSSINEAWSEVYNQLGRNKLAPLSDDEFLRAHWIMYFKYSRKRGDDYIDFLLNSYFSPKAILGEIDISLDGLPVVVERTEAVDTDDDEIVADEAEELQYVNEHRTLKDVIDYTESIKSAAPVWYATYYPNDSLELLNSDEVIAMDRLNRLGMAYFRPLVMSVMLRYSKEDSRRLAFLNAVERFVFVAMRMYRAQANYRSSDFLRAARSIFWRKLDLDQVLDAFNRGRLRKRKIKHAKPVAAAVAA